MTCLTQVCILTQEDNNSSDDNFDMRRNSIFLEATRRPKSPRNVKAGNVLAGSIDHIFTCVNLSTINPVYEEDEVSSL